jgi:hypothetical protein
MRYILKKDLPEVPKGTIFKKDSDCPFYSDPKYQSSFYPESMTEPCFSRLMNRLFQKKMRNSTWCMEQLMLKVFTGDKTAK